MAKKETKDIIIGEGRDFERIRRITGYLVGTIDRWNNAKRAEEKDRVKHSLQSAPQKPAAKKAPVKQTAVRKAPVKKAEKSTVHTASV